MIIPLNELYDEVEIGPLNLNQSLDETGSAIRGYYMMHNGSIDDLLNWDDIDLQDHEFDFYREEESQINALHILNLYVLPFFVALAFLLSALLLTITARRNIQRYHHSLIYYLALSVISIVSLVLFSIQIHFITSYSHSNFTSEFACKLLNFIHHITAHSYGYVFAAILIERTLVTAYAYRERVKFALTNGIRAAKCPLGSDWLGKITRGFSSQWATTLTISSTFLCVALNNVWTWWTYGIQHIDESQDFSWCASISPIHSVWQFSFKFGIFILQTVCVIICNIVLFTYRFKKSRVLKQKQQDHNNDRPQEEKPQTSGHSAEDLNSRLQGNYETEFSGKVQNENNNGQKTTGDTKIDISPTETINTAPPRLDVSLANSGEACPENINSRDFVAAWKADNENVEITASQTPNLSSASQSDVRNYAHDFLDPADDLKQDSLTIAAQCITLSFVITNLPNVMLKEIWIFEQSDRSVFYYVITTTFDQFLYILYVIFVPVLLFCLHRTVVLREVRVMWGEIQEFWQRVRSLFWRPNLFDRSAKGSSAHSVEGQGIMEEE